MVVVGVEQEFEVAIIFLSHLPDLKLQTDLVWENLHMLGLERGSCLVGGEEPLLMEKLHHQLPPAVQRLPQRSRPVGVQPRRARGLWRACDALRVLICLENLWIEIRAKKGVASEVGLRS